MMIGHLKEDRQAEGPHQDEMVRIHLHPLTFVYFLITTVPAPRNSI